MPPVPEGLNQPWPLTGRQEDLDAVVTALEQGCPALFIVGEAGTGKTRLAREALARMRAEGWSVAGATATEPSHATPLSALAHLVPPGAEHTPATLFEATRASIAEDTDGQPLVLHVDDAHHLDPISANLLVSLAESGTIRPVLTVRSGMSVPDGIAALRNGHETQVITLGVLDVMAADALLHRVLGGPLDGQSQARLMELSQGNPLYLRELVIAAVTSGALVDAGGVWRLTAPLPAGEALREKLLERMAALSDHERDALELLAVGEPVGLGLLETMIDAEVLEALEDRGLIRVEQDRRRQTVALAHPLYGETLRSAMGRVRRRRLLRRHVDALEAVGARRRDDAARLVRFQIDAGIAPDIDVVMRSARLARHHQDWTATAELSRAALDAGHADAVSLVVEAHYAMGEFDEADALVAKALADPAALSEDAVVSLHRDRASSLFFAHGDANRSVDELERVAATVVDPELRELVHLTRAAMLQWSGRMAEAAEVAEPILADGDPRAGVLAAMVLETVTTMCGPTGRAIELADEWFPIHLGLPDQGGTYSPGFHMVIKVHALTNAGRLAEANELGELGYQLSVATQNLVGQLWFTLQLGRVAIYRGRFAAARRWLHEQVAICRTTGWGRPITLGLSALAIAEAQAGDADAAAAAIAERDATGYATIELFATEGVRGEAWTLAARGDRSGARRLLLPAAEVAEAAGMLINGADVRFDALRLGATDQAEPLAAAAAVVESATLELAARWAASPNDGAVLDEVAAGFEALDGLMFAADAYAAAATAWRRDGNPRKAAASEQRVAELIRRCGAAPTMVPAADLVVPLTPREREIVLLVADGRSTKEAAEQLYLSPRTVSNHLQNAYTKLGVSKRSELSAALGRLDLAGEAP
jgi:DNA-binding CsgD family transcriptional regulator